MKRYLLPLLVFAVLLGFLAMIKLNQMGAQSAPGTQP